MAIPLLVLILCSIFRSCLEPPLALPDPGDSAARVVGKLSQAPEWRGVGTYLDLELQTVDAQPYRGRARLTEFLNDSEQRGLFNALDLGSGDRVEIVVKLHRPGVYQDPGVFDYRRHLERQGIYWTGTIRNPRLITVLDRGWHTPDRIKSWIQRRLEAPFAGRPEIAGLVLGMVLGRKYGLTADIERQFQAGGLYHLVVVSGFNLAVVAGTAMWLARFIPWKRRTRLLFVLGCALAYAAVAEGGAPVYRAAVAVLLSITGRLLDRSNSALNTTAGTAFFLLLMDPSSLEDPSFQMTFAAVLAVLALGVPATQWALGWLRQALKDFANESKDGDFPIEISAWRLSKRIWCELHGLPNWVVRVPYTILLVVGEALIVSLCVEMVFAGFMVESFHRLSPISPFINIPAGMVTAIVTPLSLLLVFLPGPAAAFDAWFITKLLDLLLATLRLALQIPYATVRVPSPPGWLWIFYILAATALLVAVRYRWRAFCLGCITAVTGLQTAMMFKDFSPAAPRVVTMTFLDVGQGDASLIEFPSGYRMLIDGGGVSSGRFLDLRDESTFSIGESVLSPYLFSRGIRKLDAVVLTHAHHDHMDGLFDIIENFRVGEFWLGRNPMNSRYKDLIERLQAKQIPIRWVTAGQTVGAFSVLHPPPAWTPRKNDQNNDSVVLLLRSGSATALLTGDIERSIVVPDRVDVLKVPHHGSKGVKVRPKATVRVISVGANNPFGHPHESALPALRTDRLGAITVTLESRPSVSLTETRCSCKLAFLFRSH